tara:strand:+ start:911 stop:1063 length:153 start_codon:yes stop_codon:yes gene_type:complete
VVVKVEVDHGVIQQVLDLIQMVDRMVVMVDQVVVEIYFVCLLQQLKEQLV